MGIGVGTAHADQAAPDIGYETTLVDGKTVVTTIDSGSFDVAPDGRTVDLDDDLGRTVVNLPLYYTVGPLEYPLLHEVSSDNRTLKMTPDPDITKARPAVKPVASLLENQRAQDAFITQFGIATAVGGFIGTAVGAVVGVVIALTSCGLAFTCIVTGLPIIAASAAVGAIVGTLIAGGPTLAIAGIDLISTLVAPPGTTKWNYVVPR
ncbi:ammonium transporter [Nocardiaceae bacterium YC2-7]|uniref:Ammonium transporter n=2 Tax=Antrihabitans stalactiti TaxID=2584121 RepID=A0A848KLB3_9NOCA|nr:ammonium transporter [Antrihabitans stalactiti]